jgi:shikimate kinase
MMTSTRRHVYLTGFMGTGKSLVGRALAEVLNRPFYDLDEVVEELTGRSVSAIFAAEGESEFRKYEARALRSIVSGSPSVIALGGGAPTVAAIARLAQYTGHSVWLTADWPAVWERVRDDTTRPLLVEVLGRAQSDDGDDAAYDRFVERAKSLYAEREFAYETLADWTVSTTDTAPAEVAACILEIMKEDAG